MLEFHFNKTAWWSDERQKNDVTKVEDLQKSVGYAGHSGWWE